MQSQSTFNAQLKIALTSQLCNSLSGLVGLFNFILLWPGFFILNYWKVEQFKLPPEPTVWGYITLNALIGTVLSEALWLW